MSYIQSNGHILGADEDDFSFSWDDKKAGTKVLLSKVFHAHYTLFGAILEFESFNHALMVVSFDRTFCRKEQMTFRFIRHMQITSYVP